MKEKSIEIHKHWVNTIMGMRKKKLQEREERLRKDEEERISIDQEWAKVQAEDRLKKLCYARTLQLYNSPRINKIHSAIRTGDAMKENELHLKVKGLRREAAAKKEEAEFQAMMEYIKKGEEEERHQVEAKRSTERAVREQQLKQIEERHQQDAKEKAELMEEGKVIFRLAEEAELQKRHMHEENLKNQKQITQDRLEEIEYKKKLQLVERIKEAEECEKELLFATAKRKLGIIELERKAAAAAEREAIQTKAANYLTQQINRFSTSHEASLLAAVEQDNAKWNQRVESEVRKKQEALNAIEAYRVSVLKAKEDFKARQTEEAKEDLKKLLEMDEKTHREDEERKALRLQENRELVQIYLDEIKRHEDERRKKREMDNLLASKFSQQTTEQENIFQEYAKRIINNCEQTGIPTYAMKKVANQKASDGFGIGLIGETECRVRSNGPADIDWYFNNTRLSENNNHWSKSTEFSGDVVISELMFPISRHTVGSYFCNASNRYGWSLSAPANVFIAYMEDDFTVEPQPKAASIGETVILLCVPPSGSPKPMVTWFKDDKEVDLSNRIQIVDGTNLRIEQISWHDAGGYSCVAKSLAFEKSSKKAYLRVRQRPFFLVAPESQMIPINGVAEFACRVSGEPLPTLTWRRDPPIPAISTTRSVLLADGSLKLINVQLEDAGDYICQASNDGGVVETVAHLTVTSPPGFIETPPGSAIFLEGTRAQLVCLATGSPIPEIRWINQKTSDYFLNGIRSPSQRIIVTNTGSLIINTVRLSDSGTYECRASSPAGFTRTVIYLYVQPNPHLFPGRIGVASISPVYLNHLRNTNEVRLVCSPPDLSEFSSYMASGTHNISEIGNFNPMTTFKTSWYKEKKEIALSISATDRFRSDSDNSLIIKPVHISDAGNYSCMILGLMNKRIAFWPMQISSHSDRFSKPYTSSEPPRPPSNVSVLAVGDSWISLSWDYDYSKTSESEVMFKVFYLLQFHNSTYVSNRRIKSFNSVQISKDPTHQSYEMPFHSGTVDDGQYPLDVWESSIESTREKSFQLKSLLPDSGYWIEVRASNSHLWSQGALVSHIVYTTQSKPASQSSVVYPLDPSKAAGDFQDLSARVHSLTFLGVTARSLTASEMFISWTMQTTNGALRLVDGFQIVAKPVFMSRCSARATSAANDFVNPALFGVDQRPRFGYGDPTSPSLEHAHCSFNSEQQIERFRQASVNGGQISSGKNPVPEKFLLVSRVISRDSPGTGAVMGGLHPFTCYEVSVKAFKDDQTYGRIWSRETPAELVLSLDAAPGEAPRLISADWLSNTESQNMFLSSSTFGNHSFHFKNFPSASSGIRLKWMPLDLHLSHGTLIGYSIHLIANDSNYTQSQKVSPDANSHDLLGLNPHVEYTIFLAGVTCRGEGVRGPGYRMPLFGSAMSQAPNPAELQSKSVLFPAWAYGAVSGVVVVWILIGCLFAVCLRRRKIHQNSQGFCCCCLQSPSTSKSLKQDDTAFNLSPRKPTNSFVSPVNTPETKSSHTVTTNAETQEYTSSDHHSSVHLQRKTSRNGGGSSSEGRRLLKGTESSGEQATMMLNSSSASTPSNTSNQACIKSHCLPLTASVPYPAGTTPPGGYNMINSISGFSPQMGHYEAQWNNGSQQQNSSGGRSNVLQEVPPYASSNVLPNEMNQSSWNPGPEVDPLGQASMQPAWANYPTRAQQQQMSPVNGPSGGGIPSIPPPPPYPPPPPPSGGGRGAVAPPFHANSVPTGAGIQDGHRHLSDDGSLPSGGTPTLLIDEVDEIIEDVFITLEITFRLTRYLSGYYAHDGCHMQHPSPYALQQQQFHLSPDPRHTSGEQSTGAGGTSAGSSSLSSHHMRSPPPVHHGRHQGLPAAACTPLQQQRNGPGHSAGNSSGGHSMATSHSPALGPHGYLTGGTASSNDSATSMPPNFPPSARDSRLIQAGHLALKSNSNSSGSHCSGGRIFPPAPNPPLYQTPEPVFMHPQMGLPNNHFEHRSSLGDNMTYSEVNSTTDMRDADNEADCEDDTDFDDSRSYSVFGQASSIGFPHPTAHNSNNQTRRVATANPTESPKLLA
ncbi:hypothetical protein Aperf_G00000022193 [Anoplocephala perfoliata]